MDNNTVGAEFMPSMKSSERRHYIFVHLTKLAQAL